ncbi:WxL domain-containing protein [Companilactobacillus mishanensis]|uniref:BIG2 domain-containing protein n=1 Tax=Companilactobacillus mishanensis TaxID=2486008 RepID=A0ABW9P9P9_9LACO|nr:hypothetical protein [Companilactobacillus mishanensis]MQS45950.1 hypothetical protein [Companilactobacillus mishanensis]
MRGKKLRFLMVALFAVLLIFGFSGNHDNASNVDVHAATSIPGKGSPSLPPIGLFGIYMNDGFSLQPESQYTFKDNPKTLTTATAHSVLSNLNVLGHDHFQWYQSTDQGKTWTTVDNDGTSATLEVTPKTVGVVYYQQSFKYYLTFIGSLAVPTYYSNVVSVTTLPDPVEATKLDVTTDTDYLYNNQPVAATTHAHGTPTPANSTGNITWALDETDADLATIDKTTGEITANNDNKSGTITVTGTMHNNNATTVKGSAKVKIGGGLDDQTVDEGKTATFDIQGDFGATPDSITWHKVDASGNDTVISDAANKKSYTTPATSANDDKSKFYAVVEATVDGHSNTITTNKATLNVNINKTPDVSINSKIQDMTDNTGNTEQAATNIQDGDDVKITGKITDANKNSKLSTGNIMIQVPDNIKNTYLYVDGVSQQYSVGQMNGVSYIIAPGLNFSANKTHNYEFDFTSTEKSNTSFHSLTQVQGYDSSGADLGIFNGNELKMIFTDGSVQLEANDVDFGTLTYENVGKSVDGIVKNNDNLLNVTDNRRDKSARSITLKQDTLFMNGTKKLKAILSFNDGSGNTPTPITEEATTVASSSDDAAIPSVGSKNGQGLELMLSNQAIQTGTYTSTLNWTITDAP